LADYLDRNGACLYFELSFSSHCDQLRLFETLLEERLSTAPEYLQLILSACKFLDLLLVLQTEEFQIHEWIFVTDTTDALLAPDDSEVTAVIDRIGIVLQSSLPVRPPFCALFENVTTLSRAPKCKACPRPQARVADLYSIT
jgi:hypothetical protein